MSARRVAVVIVLAATTGTGVGSAPTLAWVQQHDPLLADAATRAAVTGVKRGIDG